LALHFDCTAKVSSIFISSNSENTRHVIRSFAFSALLSFWGKIPAFVIVHLGVTAVTTWLYQQRMIAVAGAA
jgi:hypothetical protein